MEGPEPDSAWRLAREASQVGYAREQVAKALSAHGIEADTATLMVSEIVTNAIEHGEDPIELRVGVGADDMRCEVFDGGSALPRVREPDPASLRGRGLMLVSAIAAECDGSWGFTVARGGKTVWFAVPVSRTHPAESGDAS